MSSGWSNVLMDIDFTGGESLDATMLDVMQGPNVPFCPWIFLPCMTPAKRVSTLVLDSLSP